MEKAEQEKFLDTIVKIYATLATPVTAPSSGAENPLVSYPKEGVLNLLSEIEEYLDAAYIFDNENGGI